MDKQHITLQLDAHSVALHIPREDEPMYRHAATALNERYKTYLRLRPNASAELLWTLVALDEAMQLEKTKPEMTLAPYEEKMKEMSRLIEDQLTTNN